MIIQAAMLFAFLTTLMEFVIIAKIPPHSRLRLLGSAWRVNVLHAAFLGGNLFIHWGTLIGTMSGITAGLMSFIVIAICKYVWGYVKNDRWYYPGVLTFNSEEIR